MIPYNQKLDPLSGMGCGLYGIKYIILIKYGISVENNYILSYLLFFEKLKTRSRKFGASFEKLYDSYCREASKKLGINIAVKRKAISDITNDDTNTRGIGMIEYHSWKKLIDDGIFDKEDVDNFIKFDGKTYMHHLVWTGKKGGHLQNTDGTQPLPCKLEVLQYMVSKGLLWDTARTIYPTTVYTNLVLGLTLGMRRAEKLGKLKQYIVTNRGNEYMNKAIELYFYGRSDSKNFI